jgi:ribokinase
MSKLNPHRTRSAAVVVVGSLNMDLVITTAARPKPGETVTGGELVTVPGGKGGNQAAAIGQMLSATPSQPPAGSRRRPITPGCTMIARVGSDSFGTQLIDGLKRQHVNTYRIIKDVATATGVAMIVVDAAGENSILLSPGANGRLAPRDVAAAAGIIAAARVLVLQLEVPSVTVAAALRIARRAGVITILDPAPAPRQGLAKMLHRVDIITPNQSEAEALTSIAVTDQASAQRAGEALLKAGARAAVIKMGAAGALIVERATPTPRVTHVPGYSVRVVDTTAAGDSFTGAMAAALAEGTDLPTAVRFANAAGALACTKMGAQSSIPTRAAVEVLIRKHRTKNAK